MNVLTSDLSARLPVLDPDFKASSIALSPNLLEDLHAQFNGFQRHILISSFEFDSDWPNWEFHPAGDEVVILLSGRAELHLENDDGSAALTLDEPGAYAVVPQNTWHTARISTPTRLLFVTPSERTIDRPV